MKFTTIFVFLLFSFTSLTANCNPLLTGEVKYTLESARNDLLTSNKISVSQELIKDNLIDKNRDENQKYILVGRTELNDRVLAFFSDTSYAVMYLNDKLHVFYYGNNGILNYTEVKDSDEYPYKSYKYDLTGKMINMGLRVSKGETFIYTPTGKLIAHWSGLKGYDEKGNLIMTRKYFNF